MSNWPENSAVLALAVPLIKRFEGFRAQAYRDSANVPTIGYGTTRYPNGTPVAMTDAAITETQADFYLGNDVERRQQQLAPLVLARPTLHQAAAMLSLAYNIGVSAFQGSTVLRAFNAGAMQSAASAFLMWDKANVGGHLQVVPGMSARRVAERAFFLTEDTK